MDKVRVRFAPSPTGHLHVGNARTALFNWLFARHNNGQFILRIEDTDQDRSTSESAEGILKGMEYLGLDYDEEVQYQSQRIDIYNRYIDELILQGKAYRCFCTQEEVEEGRKRNEKEGKNPMYDRKCRDLNDTASDQPHVIRFKTPLEDGEVTFMDIIHGAIRVKYSEIDDFIIRRSDGLPTYNFAVVIDDALMNISHVIRGDDHVTNTPKQVLIYNALGFVLPVFAHLPMITGPDKTRLSKRHGATSVSSYMDEGFLSSAMFNFLARLGWGHESQEIFTREELIQLFTLEKVSKNAAVFDVQKLEWLNAQHMKNMENTDLLEMIKPFWEKNKENFAQYNNDKLIAIVASLKERSKTLKELAEKSHFYFTDNLKIEEASRNKFLQSEQKHLLEKLINELELISVWSTESLEEMFRQLAKERDTKLVNIVQPVRTAVTGSSASPPIFEIMEIIGRESVVDRLKKSFDHLV